MNSTEPLGPRSGEHVAATEPALPLDGLPQEEHIEQAYLFKSLLDRLEGNVPVQELMESAQHEILATTKLPMAIEFMLGELRHSGCFATAMQQLSHYFRPFQTYLIREAEDDRGRFDMRVAFAVLKKEAEYRAQGASRQGMFLFQFETLCRNRLNYDRGLKAMSDDPIYDQAWQTWILTVRRQVGLVDLADLIFVRSAHYQPRRRDLLSDDPAATQPLFGDKEGRIAQASRTKEPLLLFASLQRQLGYPAVPRPTKEDPNRDLVPQLVRQVERLEGRVKLLEDEQRGGIDLSKFYTE